MSKAQTTNLSVVRIVSGGQTGVDRGALDAAIALAIPHGGWCPRGRLAEDGTIPDRYEMTESDSPHYASRTRQNVIDSDATLILHRGPLSGGTRLTRHLAQSQSRPYLAITLPGNTKDQQRARRWLIVNQVHTLNVAGPRESTSPGIAQEAATFLKALFGA